MVTTTGDDLRTNFNMGNILLLGNIISILNLAKLCLGVCVYVMFLSCFVTSPITLISLSWKTELTQNFQNFKNFKKIKKKKKSQISQKSQKSQKRPKNQKSQKVRR